MAALARTLALGSVLLLAGCLGERAADVDSDRIPGESLTVYSSMPHGDVSQHVAAAVQAGQLLALADVGGRAGRFRVSLATLDSIEPGERFWDPERVTANAERAVDDPTAIAYLGELDHGASTISLPITNDAGMLQLSPADGLTSLTLTPPGRPRSGPDRLYPSGLRTFLRLTPTDLLVAEVLVARLGELGARRPAVVFDQSVYGRELAAQIVARARRDGPEPVRSEELGGSPRSVPGLVQKLVDERPDVVAFAGVAGPTTGPLLAELDRRLPGVPVVGGGGLLARDPARPIPAAPARVEAIAAVLPARAYPRSGRRVLRRLERRSGADVARPEALYGYESMRLVLRAVEAAGATRLGVARAVLESDPDGPLLRGSVLGRYDVFPRGDVDVERLAIHRLVDGRFVPRTVVR